MQKITINTPFITLGQFLKFSGIISSGSDAKKFLFEEIIKVNGELENRRGRKLFPGDIIEVLGTKYQVLSDENQ